MKKKKRKQYYVCIFESKKTKRRFIDLAGVDVSEKLNKINKGKKLKKWYKDNRPFKALYCEKYNTKKEAAERARELKTEERVSAPYS